MEIKILGSGCASCKKLLAITESAVKELNADVDIIYVTDIDEIISSGIMSTPGLLVNGTLKSAGRILSKKEVMKIISDAL